MVKKSWQFGLKTPGQSGLEIRANIALKSGPIWHEILSNLVWKSGQILPAIPGQFGL
jgi:hypothetical protein